jgi:hypothetical protein
LSYKHRLSKDLSLTHHTQTLQPTPFPLHVRSLIPQESLASLKDASLAGTLVITTDGSYDPITTHASYSWIFGGPHQLAKASSSITNLHRNAYRAELHGILAALVTVLWMEEAHPYEFRSATLYSDCQKALKRGLHRGPIGVKDATQDEYDLILAIRHVYTTLKTTITPLWTPGHPTKADPRGEQVKNAKAHALAVSRLHNAQETPHCDSYLERPVITVLHRSVIITKGLPQQVIADIHYEPLKLKILRDTNWTEDDFNTVDWHSLHRAMLKMPRPRQIAISKLINGLWNVNIQNHRYYWQSAACPYCPTEETMHHLLTCNSKEAQLSRQTATEKLGKAIAAAHTPEPLAAHLLHCIDSWTQDQVVRPSPGTKDKITKATREQNHIGWDNFLRGRISKGWHLAYLHFQPIQDKQRVTRASTWTRKLITAVWDYSFSLWEARNNTVHGQTEAARESKALKELRRTAKQLYNSFENDPHIVPTNQNHLFDKPLLLMLQLPFTNLQCWILSAQEAIAMQQCRDSLRNTKQRELLRQFFVPRKQIKHHGSPEGSRSSKVTIYQAPASIPPPGAAVESLLAPFFKPRTAKAVKRRQRPKQQKLSRGIVNRSKDPSHPKIGSQDTNELALLAPIFSKNIGSVSQPSLLKHNPARNQ